MISVKQMHQKSAIFVIIGTLKILVLNMSHSCNSCHGLMQKTMNFNDAAIVQNSLFGYEQRWCDKHNE